MSENEPESVIESLDFNENFWQNLKIDFCESDYVPPTYLGDVTLDNLNNTFVSFKINEYIEPAEIDLNRRDIEESELSESKDVGSFITAQIEKYKNLYNQR